MSRRRAIGAALLAAVVPVSACAKSSPSPTGPSNPAPSTPTSSALTITFDENPVPFRNDGCSFSTPQGWYTAARVRETAGITFTPTTLTQKLNGTAADSLAESFGSRFGACSGSAFTPGAIAANGAACGMVGVCTTSAYTTYQLTLAGTDANGHALSFDSPVLQLGTRPAGQVVLGIGPTVGPTSQLPHSATATHTERTVR